MMNSARIEAENIIILKWLGHSDIATTSNIYTHLDFSSKVAAAHAIIGAYPKY